MTLVVDERVGKAAFAKFDAVLMKRLPKANMKGIIYQQVALILLCENCINM